MGSRNYDFLTESFLFNDHLLSNNYKSVAERRLSQELRSYRACCKRHKNELAREVLATRSNLKMFVSDQRAHTLDFLKQTALYLDQVIFDDPLFSFRHPKSKQQRVWNQFNSIENRPIDRQELAAITRTLKSVAPMVASGFLKFLPVSYLFEAPQQMPLLHSEDRFASTLPSHLMSFWRENSVVRTLTRQGSGFRVEDGLCPCRLIDISYKDDNFMHGHMEQLFEQRVEPTKGNVVTFSMRMPEEPPAEPYLICDWPRSCGTGGCKVPILPMRTGFLPALTAVGNCRTGQVRFTRRTWSQRRKKSGSWATSAGIHSVTRTRHSSKATART
jgi:hypothetical protein